jgi:hypothetical protein
MSVVHTKYTQFFDVDIHEYLDILKGVGAQIVIWTFYDQVGQSGKGLGGAKVCATNYCKIAN